MKKVVLKSVVWTCALSFPAALIYFSFARSFLSSPRSVESREVITRAIETKSRQIDLIDQKAIVASGELLKLQEEKNRELEQLKNLRKDIDSILDKHKIASASSKKANEGKSATAAAAPSQESTESASNFSVEVVETIDTRLGKMVAIPLPNQKNLDEKTFKSISSFVQTRGAKTGTIYASGLKGRTEMLENMRQQFSKLDIDVRRFEVNELENEPTLLLIDEGKTSAAATTSRPE